MNLTIDQMKEIVGGAPDTATHVIDYGDAGIFDYLRNPESWEFFYKSSWMRVPSLLSKEFYNNKNSKPVPLSGLRASIASNDKTAGQATVAEDCEPEDEITRIGYMIEKAAKELPDGYVLNISISKEAGVVKVELPNGDEIGDFGNADGFSYEIQEALATAIWHAEKDHGHD